ncbi:MAG: hypothetical protein BGP05_20615 [Rhizobiales bacterium 62-47]|jgi:hypothetical protein|nr:MAG: hypothetical protein BGP05_20615 [Rhizobiales bacterium 62-47]
MNAVPSPNFSLLLFSEASAANLLRGAALAPAVPPFAVGELIAKIVANRGPRQQKGVPTDT